MTGGLPAIITLATQPVMKIRQQTSAPATGQRKWKCPKRIPPSAHRYRASFGAIHVQKFDYSPGSPDHTCASGHHLPI